MPKMRKRFFLFTSKINSDWRVFATSFTSDSVPLPKGSDVNYSVINMNNGLRVIPVYVGNGKLEYPVDLGIPKDVNDYVIAAILMSEDQANKS